MSKFTFLLLARASTSSEFEGALLPSASLGHGGHRALVTIGERTGPIECDYQQAQTVREVAVPSPGAVFLAVVFQTAGAAEDALATVHDLDGRQDVCVRDVAIVLRTESGRIELMQTREVALGEGVVGGGTVGLVAGLLLGLPVGGALLGLAGGGLFGMRDTGIPDGRLRELGADLKPGQAVLCVLVDANALVQSRDALQRYGAVAEVEISSGSGP
jgi:uncharacterized membrane protein